MMYKTLTSVLVVSAILAVAAPVQAQQSLNSLRGSYVYRGYGTVQGVDAPSVGRVVYDAAGNCANQLFLNLGGTLVSFTTNAPGGSCTYTVSPGGIAHQPMVFVGADGSTAAFTLDFIIVSDDTAGEFFWIASDPNGQTVGRGVTKKQYPGVDVRSFAARTFRGPWAFRTTGTVQGIDTPAMGRIRYDGAGGCSDAESWILNFGGTNVPLGTATTCSYTVSPEGLYRAEYVGSAGGAPAAFNWTGYVVGDGYQVGELWTLIMDADGQTVGRGVGKQQNR